MSYFVYELVDPRCGSVFYVGKGKGARPSAHEREARAGKPGRKCERIREIIEDGKVPTVRIVQRFDDELLAYAEEAFHIERIGIANLTNVCIGGVGATHPPKPRDPVADARHVVRSCLNSIRRVVAFEFAGHSLFLGEHDITHIIRGAIGKLREQAGEEWFNEVVGVPQWRHA